MDYDDLSDLDDVGTLELADYLGSSPRRRAPARGRGFMPQARQAMARRSTPRNVLIPGTPGVPLPGVRLQPLGLGATAFVAGSPIAQTLQASPQRPFKGQRFVVDLTRTGTTATGLVTISRLDVGTSNQLVGSGSISAAAFAATSFDTNVSLDPATPGILITAVFNISALPTSSDRVDIGATVFGTSIG